MAAEIKKDVAVPEPRGFGEHARGLAGEYAHEQGWGLNEAERTAIPQVRQPTYGGAEYDYGARDFGDEPIDMTEASGGSAGELERDVARAVDGATPDRNGGDVKETKTAAEAGRRDSKDEE